MSKTVVIADIHANLAALEAILNYEAKWDELVFLGDAVVAGPQPNEVVSLLADLRGTSLMGNHDREVLETDTSIPTTDPHRLWICWTRQVLTVTNIEFLSMFSPAHQYKSCNGLLQLLHGDLPKELGRRLWPDSPSEVFDGLKAQYPGSNIFIGHSHIQFARQHHGTLVVNPGGVGQQRLGLPEACYAVVEEGDVYLRSVPYDIEKTCAAMENVPLTDRAFITQWQDCYRTGILPARYKIRDFSLLKSKGYR